MVSGSCPELTWELSSDADLGLQGAEVIILPSGLAANRDHGTGPRGGIGGNGGGKGTAALPDIWRRCWTAASR